MIEIKDLTFTYHKNNKPTINNLNFSVNKGEVFGLLGPSGAGKSTTQKIIIGILKNYQGSVKVMNQEIRNIKHDFYEKIGVSFELPNLYTKFTANENLTFFKGMYKKNTINPKDLLNLVGLGEDANKKISDFSKGMKMRLNFCRAFLNDPEIIFLDEPTSGLDPVNARGIKDIILEKKREGKTIFLTTHNMNVADELCDRVAFIVDGKIPVIDSPRNLKLEMGTKALRVEYREKNLTKSKEFKLKDIGNNLNYLQFIKEKEIERMYTLDASLEEIFIKITGRELV